MPKSEGISPLPTRLHVYQNHTLDSTYWDRFAPRSDDIIIATSIKAGTTWLQTIVASLIFQEQQMPAPVWQLSPWIDVRPGAIDARFKLLEDQSHRRFVKTHLPLDGLIYYPEVKYIYVGRDGRDVFMSLWNHHRHYQDFDLHNDTPDLIGDPLPRAPEDIHRFFHDWITKGWFSWESEGYPYWSVLQHAQTWWTYRDLPNIRLVHFNDLLADLEGEMRGISDYLEIKVSESSWPALVDSATFKTMKRNAENVVPDGGTPFSGGAQRFMYKGTNGRWKGVLSAEELELYDETVSKVVSRECARWLEHGQADSS